jgi:DNA-binding NarL/FixJ family response regulator
MNPPRILIVDKSLDDFLASLRHAPTLTVVGEAQTAPQALTLAGQLHPEVILLNVDTLCATDVQWVALLNQLHPPIKLMLVSANYTPDDLLLEAYRQGVCAYLLKTQTTLAEMVEAVHALSRGESVLNPQLAGGILDEIARSPHKESSDSNGVCGHP